MSRRIDAYGVIVGLEYYGDEHSYLKANDIVRIEYSGRVFLDGTLIGCIAKQDKYYEEAENILETLLTCNTYSLHTDDYCFCEKADINDFFVVDDYADGQIVYADDKKAIVFLGTGDEEDFFPEEDACYQLTDLGREILNLIENGDGSMSFSITEETTEETVEEEINFDDFICPTGHIGVVEREEEKPMNKLFGNFGFGKCQDNRFSLSMNGIAVRQANTGKYVVYNKENNEFVDTTDMLLTIKDALFLLPAVEVNAGDTIIHEGKPYYIVGTGREIKAVSYDDCTQTVLIPKSTMFGIKYFIKVFSMFGDNFAATGDLFSNPMMLMALMGDDKDSDISKFMLMSSMSKGDFASNPMLMTFLMKDGNSDLSTLAMMSMFNNGTNPFVPAKKKADKE